MKRRRGAPHLYTGAIIRPDGEEHEIRRPAGRLCSSFRTKLIALQAALKHLLFPAHEEDPIVVCTDSRSALMSLRSGPAAQSSPLGIDIWRSLRGLAAGGRQLFLQWVPSHCGTAGNERADTIAKEACSHPQDNVPVDGQTAHRVAARVARARTFQAWPAGWFRLLMGAPPPRPPSRAWTGRPRWTPTRTLSWG